MSVLIHLSFQIDAYTQASYANLPLADVTLPMCTSVTPFWLDTYDPAVDKCQMSSDQTLDMCLKKEMSTDACDAYLEDNAKFSYIVDVYNPGGTADAPPYVGGEGSSPDWSTVTLAGGNAADCEEECKRYYKSDRVAGLRLFWAGLFTQVNERDEFSIMLQIQKSIDCCGFYAPLRCEPIPDPYPDNLPLDYVDPQYTDQILECGPEPLYYEAQPSNGCIDLKDPITKELAGCKYDMGAGDCFNNEVTADSTGCVQAIEDYIVGLITLHILVILYAAIFNYCGMYMQCCMWWKRKREDAFPNIFAEVRAEFDYHSVKHQFEVIAEPGLLTKRGYLKVNPRSRRISPDDDEEEGMSPNRTQAEARIEEGGAALFGGEAAESKEGL